MLGCTCQYLRPNPQVTPAAGGLALALAPKHNHADTRGYIPPFDGFAAPPGPSSMEVGCPGAVAAAAVLLLAAAAQEPSTSRAVRRHAPLYILQGGRTSQNHACGQIICCRSAKKVANEAKSAVVTGCTPHESWNTHFKIYKSSLKRANTSCIANSGFRSPNVTTQDTRHDARHNSRAVQLYHVSSAALRESIVLTCFRAYSESLYTSPCKSSSS